MTTSPLDASNWRNSSRKSWHADFRSRFGTRDRSSRSAFVLGDLTTMRLLPLTVRVLPSAMPWANQLSIASPACVNQTTNRHLMWTPLATLVREPVRGNHGVLINFVCDGTSQMVRLEIFFKIKNSFFSIKSQKRMNHEIRRSHK